MYQHKNKTIQGINTFITKYFYLLLLFLLVIPVLFPFTKQGFFTMHDDQQVARLYEMDRSLAAGQFPVRWVADLGFGYGYPLFIFYPPFVYYLGEVFHLLLGTGFIVSAKLVFIFAFLGAAVSIFIWAKEHFGKKAALVTAVFYTYAPYHAVDAYVRGALAELTAFVWLPAILWSTDRLILYGEKNKWIWLGILLALLMITHNLIFLPFFPLFLIYAGFLMLKSEKKFSIVYTSCSILLALGLSAFYWMPVLAEKKATLVDSVLRADLAQHELHFVYPSQLWNSLWGYGGSTQGPLDGMSFKIGKLHVLLSFTAPLLWFLLSKFKKKKDLKNKFHFSLILSLLFLISALLTTSYSKPVWDFIKPLQYLQFPWRFLTFTALFSSMLSGSALAAVLHQFKPKFVSYSLTTLIVILVVVPNLKLFRPQNYLAVTDEYYTNEEFLKWKISKTSFEFVPKSVKTRKEWNTIERKYITQIDINRDQIPSEPVTLLSGDANFKIQKNVPGELRLSITARRESEIRINSFDFPGWILKLNNEIIPHRSDNDLALITAEIPAGEHQLLVKYKNSPLISIANTISLGSILVLMLARKPSFINLFLKSKGTKR